MLSAFSSCQALPAKCFHRICHWVGSCLNCRSWFIVMLWLLCIWLFYSYWLVFLQGVRLQSRYLTEELQKIFTEDTDSETEVFEGFTSSEVDVNKKGVLVKAVTYAWKSMLASFFLSLLCKPRVLVGVFLLCCDVLSSCWIKMWFIFKEEKNVLCNLTSHTRNANFLCL